VRIREQVQDDLLELVRVGPQWRQLGREVQREDDAVHAQAVGDELDGLPDDLVQRHLLPLGWMLASQGEKILHETRAALGGVQDLLATLLETRRVTLYEKGAVAENHRERIVQLMRDAGNE